MSIDITANADNAPDELLVDTVERFDIVEYGMELISNPAEGAYLPSLFLMGKHPKDKDRKATAIVYFHESTQTGTPGFDPRSQIIYIHYPLSLFQSVLTLLQSKEGLQFYWKKTGSKQWTGINYRKAVKKKDQDITPA